MDDSSSKVADASPEMPSELTKDEMETILKRFLEAGVTPDFAEDAEEAKALEGTGSVTSDRKKIITI